MEIIKHILLFFEYTLLVLTGVTTIYMFFYSVMGRIYRKNNKSTTSMTDKEAPRVGVIIPAYKEDNVILKTVVNALNQKYPIGKFQIIVVGDQLKPSTVFNLRKLPILFHEVNFEKSTKAKALNYAIERSNIYDLIVVLDADNIIENNFITKMAEAFNKGYKAIQGHRTAKNYNNQHSLLDAISEEINNHIFCKGQQYIGMSSRLTGSGMAFEYSLFKKLMFDIDAVGGFDKELEIKLLANETKIHYVDDAIIFDEKVSTGNVMVNQRKRWISSQFHYMKKYAHTGIKELLFSKNLDYFNKTLQLLLIPRALMFALLFFGISTSLLLGSKGLTTLWIFMLVFYVAAFIVAFPSKFLSKRLFALTLKMPKTLTKLLLATTQIKNANKEFIHTPHSS